MASAAARGDHPPSQNLYVSGLSEKVNDSVLRQWFCVYGHVRSVMVSVDVKTAKSKGFGFVQFGHLEEAVVARDALHEKEKVWEDDRCLLKIEFSAWTGTVESDTIFVRNIPKSIGEEELTNYFKKFGPLAEPIRVHAIKDAPGLRMASVHFETVDDARNAKEQIHCRPVFDGCQINVICRFAESEEERTKHQSKRAGGGASSSAGQAPIPVIGGNSNSASTIQAPPSPVQPRTYSSPTIPQREGLHLHRARANTGTTSIPPHLQHLTQLMNPMPPTATQFIRFEGVIAVTTDNQLVVVEADRMEALPLSYRARAAAMPTPPHGAIVFSDQTVMNAHGDLPAQLPEAQQQGGGYSWGDLGGGSWMPPMRGHNNATTATPQHSHLAHHTVPQSQQHRSALGAVGEDPDELDT